MKKLLAESAIAFFAMSFLVGDGRQAEIQAQRIERHSSTISSSVGIDIDYGRMPLSFIPNEGQLEGRGAFFVQGKEQSVYFAPDGLTFILSRHGVSNDPIGDQNPLETPLRTEKSGPERWVVKLDFVGARPDVKPVGEEKTGGIVSYFKGKPEEWRAGLPTYSRIVYPGLWPGIDLVYYGTFDRLKYEFIVHPGADPSQIRLVYRGVDGIAVDDGGRLEVKIPWGGFHDDAPSAFQEIAGKKKGVALRYRVDAKGDIGDEAGAAKASDETSWAYGFEVGEYDSAHPLVLDPVLVIFAGFIGGSGIDQAAGVAVDSTGNVYVAGLVSSTETTFPETVGPDLFHNGGYDAFVAKVAASGTGLVYCGYIGGTADDFGSGIAVDTSGNAYVTGSTQSTETSFPVVAGYDMTHNGLADAFVAKVNPAGDALVYCTYIGGAGEDGAEGIALDGSGNAYVAGWTSSTEATFPEITGPDLSYNGGSYDAFICKLNASGTGRYYCGYIGGSAEDKATGIALDGSGNAYLAGYALSDHATFPVTVGPDLTHNGNPDGFVAKVNSSGTALAYCGYIGSGGNEWGTAIAVDSWGNAYAVGITESWNFPGYAGYADGFIAKVNAAGDSMAYCRAIGGGSNDYAFGVAVDGSGNAYIAGWTESADFPVVEGPDLTLGARDGFIAKMNAYGSRLTYCSYIGGHAHLDSAESVAVDAWENAYIAGWARSVDFPVLVGPDLSYNGGDFDAFVTRYYSYFIPALTRAVGDFDGDGTEEAVLDLGSLGAWMYDGGAWTQLSAMNPEGMIKANIDGNTDDEIFMEFGYSGLWLWDGGSMTLLSEETVETMAAGDMDADGNDELAVDFGAVGLWLWNGGSWNQLSGVNLEYMVVANLDGSGGAEIIGDFGTVGLWSWSGGAWTQLSGVNVQYMIAGDTDDTGGKELIGDFGPVGLWLYRNAAWEQWSGVNADYMITADIDDTDGDEVFGDFAWTGLWLWDSGAWSIVSGLNVEDMISADTDGDGADEMVADFATIGVWHWDGGAWNQISGVDTEGLTAGDIDGDGADEVFADFGTLGLWLWNAGTWSQISAVNPD